MSSIFDQLESTVGLVFMGVFDVKTVRGDEEGLEVIARGRPDQPLLTPFTYRFELPGTPFSMVAPGTTCGFETEAEALAAAERQAAELLAPKAFLVSERLTPEHPPAPVGVCDTLRDAVTFVMAQPGYYGKTVQQFSSRYGVNIYGGLYRHAGFINFKIDMLPKLG